MGIEIERKFLVKNSTWMPLVVSRSFLRQGYLAVQANATVRIRIQDDRAFLTIKSGTPARQRAEFEYPVPVADAEDLLRNIAMRPFIQKTRNIVVHHGQRWEIDVFEEENSGLILAEIETESEDQAIDIPDWVGEEVTADARYYNASLISRPFRSWAAGTGEN